MPYFADRVKTTSPSTGQGAITLSSTGATGYQAFPSSLDGETVGYVIESGTDWEIGTGTYTHSSLNLTRSLRSSSTGSLLSLGSGPHTVFLTPAAQDLQIVEAFSSTSDLPSASSNHGRIYHVHGEGAMYFAHGGSWHKLANATAATTSADGLMSAADKTKLDGIETSADVTDTTNVVAALTAGTNITIAADGTISSSASGGGGASYSDPIRQTEYTGTATNTFNASSSPALPAYTAGNIQVFLNGSKLAASDFTATDGTSVVLGSACAASDVVTIVEYGAPFASQYSSTIFTVGTSSEFNTSSKVLTTDYTVGKVAVYLNGVKLVIGTNADCTATDGLSINLSNAAPVTGDTIEVVEHGTLADTVTTLTGLSDTPSSLGTAGQVLQVNSGANALEFADASGGVDNQGTLTKTFTQNEEATITLSNAVTPVPMVSVFKEISQIGVSSKGNWDVNSTGSNYDLFDEAGDYSGVSLTPSSATADGTFTLSSGSFAASDVGKTVAGNGGKAIITSTSGGYDLQTNFTNTNAIAAGSWTLNGVVPNSDGSGLSVSAYIPPAYQLSNASYDNKSLSVGSQDTQPKGVDISNDGRHFIMTGNGSDDLHYYSIPANSPFDISTASYVNKIDLNGTIANGCCFSNTGHMVFVCDNGTQKVESFNLSTNFDVSTASSGTLSTSLTTVSSSAQGGLFGVQFSNDGSKMFTVDRNNNKIHEYDCGSAFDVTDLTYVDAFNHGTSSVEAIQFNDDGTKLFILNYGSDKVVEYNLTAAFDISTASVSSPEVSFSVVNQEASGMGFCFGDSGAKMYVAGSTNDTIYQYSTGGSPSVPTSQYFPSITNVGGQIDSSSWSDINSMTADEAAGDGTVHYAVSTDGRTTWKIAHNTDGVRSIAQNNSGTWQYNNSTSYASTTWANATTNNELSCLQQALSSQSVNRMDKTQLDAVSDANHFTLGNTLDLMIGLQISSGTTVPKSDGVSINYDAAAIVRQAVNGTDYEAEFPSSTSVKIKSLAAQNLKVRVL